jgi:hypothetical protein
VGAPKKGKKKTQGRERERERERERKARKKYNKYIKSKNMNLSGDRF